MGFAPAWQSVAYGGGFDARLEMRWGGVGPIFYRQSMGGGFEDLCPFFPTFSQSLNFPHHISRRDLVFSAQ